MKGRLNVELAALEEESQTRKSDEDKPAEEPSTNGNTEKI
jgi:hypothetical protein